MDLSTFVPLCVALLGAGAFFQRMNNRIDALEKRVDQLGNNAGHRQGDLIARIGMLALVAGIVVLLAVLVSRLP